MIPKYNASKYHDAWYGTSTRYRYQQYRTVPYHNTTFSTAGTAGMNRGYCVLYASVKDIQLCRSFYPGLRDLNSVAEILKGKIMYYCITRMYITTRTASSSTCTTLQYYCFSRPTTLDHDENKCVTQQYSIFQIFLLLYEFITIIITVLFMKSIMHVAWMIWYHIL